MGSRRFDVVIFGATGFTGKFVAQHVAQFAPLGARIGIAGRDVEKLKGVAATLALPVQLVRADSGDPASLAALAAESIAIATTVGPYRKYGLPLVEACARAGTHLCDINGEVLYMREAIDRFDAAAKASGARIVTSCGFDSIPSDLGMWTLAHAANEPLAEAALVVDSMRGGFSGGTIASFSSTLDAAREDRAARKILLDPYSLSPDRAAEPDLGPQRDGHTIRKDALAGGWTAPFIMESINSRVVRRSNALLGHAWGKRLRYREVFLLKTRPLAFARGAALPLAFAGIARARRFGVARRLLDKVLPPPGTGPDEPARLSGNFKLRLLGLTESGRKVAVRVFGDGDPGYAATARMLGEAVMALAFDGDALPSRAGLLTPSTGLGAALVARLRPQRVTFDV